ncbi:MAG: type II toxin-antitoxin system VapB family antitoxin [Hyphomicrobiales bacterium]|nr:type II toxin-antitoxin system VapB family antitoxin [Hyphomicrobiales bacterium]
MALSIKDPETERSARTPARLTGENITTASKRAIEERLRRVDEILGYDQHGLPRSRAPQTGASGCQIGPLRYRPAAI